MRVIKRDLREEPIKFDKVTSRIERLCYGLNMNVIDASEISQKVVSQIFDGITTSQIDELASQICFQLNTTHPDYGILAARIAISNLQKNTEKHFSDVIELCYNRKDIHDNSSPLIDIKLKKIVEKHKDTINSAIIYQRDFDLSYFGFRTLQRSYLMKLNGTIVERPQHLFMRVALGIHGNNIVSAIETYNFMSERYFTHATPTLFNAGTPRPQLSSCFLLGTNDSIEGITNTWADTSLISKWAGGIGLHISNIRAKGSLIRGTNGLSSGIFPMLQVYNKIALYVNQGGKRAGSIAVYLEPWHADIFSFLEGRKGHGSEDERARDLFYGLWIPDLFMKRVKNKELWSLMCPDECPGLPDVYGDEFEELYTKYESEKKFKKQVPAGEVWTAILDAQIETGTPYMCYKDNVNKKNNQKNIGVIKSSNLCTEIMEYSDDKEYAVCNLASIALPKFVNKINKELWKNCVVYSKEGCPNCDLLKQLLQLNQIQFTEIKINQKDERIKFYNKINDSIENEDDHIFEMPQLYVNNQYYGSLTKVKQHLKPTIDYQKLYEITKVITRNLNKIIDCNYYPSEKCRYSNLKNRPIGIGVQGLADLYIKMRVSFDSPEARRINKNIFETIYHASLQQSMELSFTSGPYDMYQGSPASEGILQFDMWNVTPDSGLWDWDTLKKDISLHGLRNSLLVAPMPTASTSQIMGNNECIEPYTSNLYTRKTLAGEFIIINKHLIHDLLHLNLWNEDLKNKIIYNNGSVQDIQEIPDYIKNLYKTVWEIKQKVILDQAIDRGAYIDQSQSLNIHIANPTRQNLTSVHFYGWKGGLKTGSYYLRTKAASQAKKFSLDMEDVKRYQQNENNSIEKKNEEECLSCGS